MWLKHRDFSERIAWFEPFHKGANTIGRVIKNTMRQRNHIWFARHYTTYFHSCYENYVKNGSFQEHIRRQVLEDYHCDAMNATNGDHQGCGLPNRACISAGYLPHVPVSGGRLVALSLERPTLRLQMVAKKLS